ncbi:MAG: RDD family protein, partial [Planctomycetota bacterium]
LLFWFVGGTLMALLGGLNLSAYMFALTMIILFLVTNFYGTAMETFYNGRTIGKWAMGIRVIGVDGGPINGTRAFLRNLLRFADLMPMAALSDLAESAPPIYLIPTGVIGLVAVIASPRMQRLGDMAAGTMVIVDERAWRLPVAKVDDPRVEALASFIPPDYRITRSMSRTLAVYAERRHYLTPPRRREIARHLTVPLIDRFEFRRDIDPDLLMYALYFKAFLADPAAEPDLGPLAGFSPLRRDQNKPQGLEPVAAASLSAPLQSTRELPPPAMAPANLANSQLATGGASTKAMTPLTSTADATTPEATSTDSTSPATLSPTSDSVEPPGKESMR